MPELKSTPYSTTATEQPISVPPSLPHSTSVTETYHSSTGSRLQQQPTEQFSSGGSKKTMVFSSSSGATTTQPIQQFSSGVGEKTTIFSSSSGATTQQPTERFSSGGGEKTTIFSSSSGATTTQPTQQFSSGGEKTTTFSSHSGGATTTSDKTSDSSKTTSTTSCQTPGSSFYSTESSTTTRTSYSTEEISITKKYEMVLEHSTEVTSDGDTILRTSDGDTSKVTTSKSEVVPKPIIKKEVDHHKPKPKKEVVIEEVPVVGAEVRPPHFAKVRGAESFRKIFTDI